MYLDPQHCFENDLVNDSPHRPDNMIEPQVQLVEGESLLGPCGHLAWQIGSKDETIATTILGTGWLPTWGIVVRLLVVDLEAGKQRVLEAHVDAHNVKDDGVGLVGLQGRGDRQAGLK